MTGMDYFRVPSARMEKWSGLNCCRLRLHGIIPFKLHNIICVPFQIQFLVTRGPESVGFVAIDDFEMFTETDALPCPFQPVEANPRPETTTASSGVRSCDFEEGLCGWEIRPPQATFTWSRTSIPELEERGELHPDRLPDGGTDG